MDFWEGKTKHLWDGWSRHKFSFDKIEDFYGRNVGLPSFEMLQLEENGRQLLLQSNGADCYLLGTQARTSPEKKSTHNEAVSNLIFVTYTFSMRCFGSRFPSLVRHWNQCWDGHLQALPGLCGSRSATEFVSSPLAELPLGYRLTRSALESLRPSLIDHTD